MRQPNINVEIREYLMSHYKLDANTAEAMVAATDMQENDTSRFSTKEDLVALELRLVEKIAALDSKMSDKFAEVSSAVNKTNSYIYKLYCSFITVVVVGLISAIVKLAL